MAKRKREATGIGNEIKRTRVKSSKAPHFPFLRLPAQLRNAVYHYVFSGGRYAIYYPGCTLSTGNMDLLFVSRQVHTECALLPYKLFTFSFCWSSPIREFLEARTEQQLRSIKYMRVLNFVGRSRCNTATYWFEYFGCEKK